MLIRKDRIHFIARQRKIGALTVSVLLLCVAFTSMLVIIPERAEAAHTDFAYYKLITIDHTKVNGSHTNFVVFLGNTSDDFDNTHIQDDADDIAFFSYDNSTQYSHDIELYNGATGEIGIWVNVSDNINNVADFRFWIYYGDADGSDQRDMDGTWGPEFEAVWHMNESSPIANGLYDSSGNGNNASSDGQGVANRVAGQCGYALDTSGEICFYIEKPSSNLDAGANDFAIVAVFKRAGYGATNVSLLRGCGATAHRYDFSPTMINGTSRFLVDDGAAGRDRWLGLWNNNLSDANYHCVYGARKNDAGGAGHDYLRLRQDNLDEGYLDLGDYGTLTDTCRTYLLTSNSSLLLPGELNGYWYGEHDELWFIKGDAKNQSWASTLVNNTLSPETFVTFGSQQSAYPPSSFLLEGLEGTDKNVTWAGTSGTTVWSNATAGSGGTMDIYMIIDTIDNVTDIRVYCDNLDATITASNISMEVSSDNITWSGNTFSFSDGGSNITINNSQWANLWCNGANPFSGAGLTDKTAHIYCRFTLAIPSEASSGTYSQSDWKVYPGHYA